MKVITIDAGRTVICDDCNKDYTDLDDVGGLIFCGRAICPDCAPNLVADAVRFNEIDFINARCPAGKSFADWVREDLR